MLLRIPRTYDCEGTASLCIKTGAAGVGAEPFDLVMRTHPPDVDNATIETSGAELSVWMGRG